MSDSDDVTLHVIRNRSTGDTFVNVSELIPWLEGFDIDEEALDQLRLLPHDAAYGTPISTMKEIG